MRRPWRLLAAALATLTAGPAIALAADGEVTLRLTAGYDTNPNRVSHAGEPAGMFSEQRLDATLRFAPERRAGWFLDLRARQRLHESSVADADARSALVSTGVDLKPVDGRRRSLSLRLGARGATYETTFVDPETGRVFEYAPSGDPSAVPTPLPERFDYRSGAAFADLRWRVKRRVRLSLDTSLEDRDYLEDYESAGLDSLDFRALSIEPGVLFRAGRIVTVHAALPTSRRDYDDRPALDSGGAPVAGTSREYRFQGLRLAFTVRPSKSLRLRADVRRTDRTDRYAGHYDSQADTVYLWLERSFGERAELELYVSRTRYDYDNAAVPDDPTGLARGGRFATMLSRYERALRPGLRLFAEVGSQSGDNHDPALSYDREWVQTGLQYSSKSR